MRKFFLVFTVLLSIAASAQLKWGPVAGFSSSNIGPMDLVSTSRFISFEAGLMADFKMNDGLHIFGQLLYAPLGYHKSDIDAVDENGNNVGKIEKHQINYITLPLYLSYIMKAKDFSFNLGFGPFISFQAGDKLKILNGETYRNGTVFPGGVRDINSLLTGLGIEMGAEWSAIMLIFHFKHSFNSIYENHPPFPHKWKINSFGVSVGYYFRKK